MGSEDWNGMPNANLSAPICLQESSGRTAVSLAEIGDIRHPRWGCPCARCGPVLRRSREGEWGNGRSVRLQKVHRRESLGSLSPRAGGLSARRPGCPCHSLGAQASSRAEKAQHPLGPIDSSAATELRKRPDDPSATGIFADTSNRNAVIARNDWIFWSDSGNESEGCTAEHGERGQ